MRLGFSCDARLRRFPAWKMAEVLMEHAGLDQLKIARSREMRRCFRQGDKVTVIYFIEAGRLRLKRRTFDGRSLIVGTAPLRWHPDKQTLLTLKQSAAYKNLPQARSVAHQMILLPTRIRTANTSHP